MPPTRGGRSSGRGNCSNLVAFRRSYSTGSTVFNSEKINGFKLPKTTKTIDKDEKFKRLRMPDGIRSVIPSMRDYNLKRSKSNKELDIVKDTIEILDDDMIEPPIKLGQRGKKHVEHCILHVCAERNFSDMIWDIALSENKSVICTSKAAILCRDNFQVTKELEKVSLPGCAVFLKTDNKIALCCRQYDKVHIYTSDGNWIKEWCLQDMQPTGLAALSNDNLIISDPGKKKICIFTIDGKKVKDILAPYNHPYQWPLYITSNHNDEIYLADCHAKLIHVFSSEGCWLHTIQPTNVQGSAIAQPHSLTSDKFSNIFIVDNTCGVIEIWRSTGVLLQSLISSNQSSLIKPIAIDIHRESNMCAIGGKFGVVRLYRLENIEPASQEMYVDLTSD